MHKIPCFYCQKEIKSKNDMVVTLYLFFIKPYHLSCYSKELKSIQVFFLRNCPLNGIAGTSAAVLTPFIGLIVVLMLKSSSDKNLEAFIPLFALFLIPTLLSLYSYYKFERHLK